ncbi:hypothetical protein [Pontibacter liquoris]|uniref:hypothetical protein n=1 Tax=Pontibacter liquoris TaxID=2905677 RepID=UPI001FA80273|nr:hypothetical protein [Pontibacter liquoris]
MAQTTTGTKVIAGSVSLRTETIKNNNGVASENSILNRTINLNPSVGYFVKDGLLIGIGVGLSQYASKLKQEEGHTISTNNSISFRPYIQKYFTITDNLLLHATGYASVGIGNGKYQGLNTSSNQVISTSRSVGLGLYPGLTYFATPKLGLTATFGSLAYTGTQEKPKDTQQSTRTYNTFTANLSPNSISVGVGYYLAR